MHSYIVERPVEESVELTSERLEVERRPVNGPVAAADEFREAVDRDH